MPIRELSFDEVVSRLKNSTETNRTRYFAMYSSWYGGIIKDPQLMMLPIDDHMVHRGDGVFEAIKCIDGGIYALERHLERLFRSANLISLKLPHELKAMHEICVETVRASKAKDCLLRLFLSRGPGGFTTNPYDTMGTQVYLVITSFTPASAERYETGVSAKVSSFRVKEGFFATVKSCNYLPNVLMKKEAIDSGVDFTVSRDEDGRLAEGSTENFAIVSKDNIFVVPGFERILKGVTAARAMELAQEKLVKTGLVKAVKNGHILADDLTHAKEAMMLGTTLDCMPVTTFEGAKISGGVPGPVAKELLKLLREDMKSGPLVTRV
jgi:branched-subunit amino acid aminotransferase/4-amino-4-deoxychorismate lyase